MSLTPVGAFHVLGKANETAEKIAVAARRRRSRGLPSSTSIPIPSGETRPMPNWSSRRRRSPSWAKNSGSSA